MKANANQTIQTYAMLADGDSVVVGVSGGADSMALLYFLRFDCGLSLSLTVCHVNHMLREDAADADQRFVERVCREWGIPCETLRCDVRARCAESGGSFEETARAVRYAFFETVAARTGGKIATAHTLSDRAETLLLNLTRGCSVDGLRAIPPVRDNIIRPLLFCTREQVEAYCAAHHIDFVTDQTNFSDAYARNRIRLQVVPALQTINPAFYSACARLMDAAQADADYLHTVAADALEQARRQDAFDRDTLLALPPAVQSRTLALLLREAGLPVTAARIDRLLSTLRTGRRASLPDGRCATLRKGLLRIESAAVLPYFEVPLDGQTIRLANGDRFEVTRLTQKQWEDYRNVNKNFFFSAIDCAKIVGKIVLRQRKDGDRIRLAGRGVTKTLKKLLNEAGLSAAQKSAVAVLADEQGPVAVDGFGVAARCAPDAASEAILVVRRTNETSTDGAY